MSQPADPTSPKDTVIPEIYRLTGPEEKLYSLNNPEIAWRDRQDLLESHGYILRPRFRRDWIPSWKVPGQERHPVRAEDSIQHWNRRTIDAIRQKDGLRVCLKIVRADGPEQNLTRMLSPERHLNDPKNHCVPILDFFVDDVDGYLVMPLLKEFDEPPFLSVDEVLDFIQQTLEGLSFIHSQGIAHRDCTNTNIMMDATEMYPRGFHPTYPFYTADGTERANPRCRRDVSVRYYFTDFGIAVERKDPNSSKLVTGINGQDQELPELSRTVPYDPFAADVFILGNLYQKALVMKYTNLSFLSPLIEAMTRKDAKARPTIDEAIKMYEDILAGQRSQILRRRLIPASDGRLKRLFLHVSCVAQENFATLRQALSEFRIPLRRTQSANRER